MVAPRSSLSLSLSLSLSVPLPPTILHSQACSECHSTWFCLRGTRQSLACIASQVFWVLVQKSVRFLKEQEKERRGEERKGKGKLLFQQKQKHRLKTTTIGQMNCLVHPFVASCLQFLHKSQNTSATSAEQKTAFLLGLLWLIPVMLQMGLFHDPSDVLWNGGGPVPPRNAVSRADGFNKGPFQSDTGCSHLGITKRVCACPSPVVAF